MMDFSFCFFFSLYFSEKKEKKGFWLTFWRLLFQPALFLFWLVLLIYHLLFLRLIYASFPLLAFCVSLPQQYCGRESRTSLASFFFSSSAFQIESCLPSLLLIFTFIFYHCSRPFLAALLLLCWKHAHVQLSKHKEDYTLLFFLTLFDRFPIHFFFFYDVVANSRPFFFFFFFSLFFLLLFFLCNRCCPLFPPPFPPSLPWISCCFVVAAGAVVLGLFFSSL